MTKSVLLVDDEPLISKALERNLQSLGFRVRTAHTVEEACLRLGEDQFDLVVTEFNVRSDQSRWPRAGNGLNLLGKIRSQPNHIAVLMYTAMQGDVYQKSSLEAGADVFLTKTDDVRALASWMERINEL